MKKATAYRVFAICALMFDILLQIAMINPLPNSTWMIVYDLVMQYSMYNVALIYFLVNGIFGNPFWGLVGFLFIILLYAIALAALFWNKKKFFYLPVLITAINICCSIALCNTQLFSPVGLIYKLIICMIHIILIVHSTERKP